GSNPTVNGVTFTGGNSLDDVPTGGHFTLTATGTSLAEDHNTGSGAPPPFSTLPAPYQTLLSNYTRVQTPDTMTLTMSGLTTGHQYEFECWSNQTNSSTNISTTVSDGNNVTLSSNTTSALGGLGQFAVGTFQAGGSGTETVTFSGSVTVLVNGFQLRDI